MSPLDRTTLVRTLSFVREQRVRLHPGHQRVSPGQIMNLPGGQRDLQGIAESIHQNVNFGAQAALASPDRLIFPSFFWRRRCVDGLAQ